MVNRILEVSISIDYVAHGLDPINNAGIYMRGKLPMIKVINEQRQKCLESLIKNTFECIFSIINVLEMERKECKNQRDVEIASR